MRTNPPDDVRPARPTASPKSRRWRGSPWLLAATLMLGACAGTPPAPASGTGSGAAAVERWTLTEAIPAARRESATEQSRSVEPVRIVILRRRDGGDDQMDSAAVVVGSGLPAPINVYIDARYQASLVGDTYTEQRLCPGEYRIAARRTDVDHRHLSRHGGQRIVVGTAPVQAFELIEARDGTFRIEAAAPDRPAGSSPASVALRQRHTIARLSAPVRCDGA